MNPIDALEAEAIHVLRESVVQFARPVLAYSIGKDSTALLHLARKAFSPGRLPFPVLHIDTGWKFSEMLEFRDREAKRLSLDLRVHTHAQGQADGINPFDHGSKRYTHVMKTLALRQALEAGGFDALIGGGRRDEEASRSKERVFSLRDRHHGWDPRRQRPELWRLFNGRLGPGETMRAFPLSNWTEIDVWRYLRREAVAVVPLYFAKERPVVWRDGSWIMRDDQRMVLRRGESVQMKSVRFRTLGCYPLTGAVESRAATISAVIDEVMASRYSERQGRLIDADEAGAMEKKKREGYF
ncbi:MAG: sulfate adenylyltransferase subunit CysD [Ramlibacter sp.]|nr:sulfate adenylyltransferase subunit CysD [Ramlibacter sp.]MCW5651594.1 sulfate adenylyltransferase subunit CysD [Ramlibacter sp.]